MGLLEHQLEALDFFELKQGRVLLADEMGLGKTVETLAYLRENVKIRPALIICPASLKLNWEKEAKKWLSSKDNIEVLSGKTSRKLEKDNRNIYIINYDS